MANDDREWDIIDSFIDFADSMGANNGTSERGEINQSTWDIWGTPQQNPTETKPVTREDEFVNTIKEGVGDFFTKDIPNAASDVASKWSTGMSMIGHGAEDAASKWSTGATIIGNEIGTSIESIVNANIPTTGTVSQISTTSKMISSAANSNMGVTGLKKSPYGSNNSGNISSVGRTHSYSNVSRVL